MSLFVALLSLVPPSSVVNGVFPLYLERSAKREDRDVLADLPAQ